MIVVAGAAVAVVVHALVLVDVCLLFDCLFDVPLPAFCWGMSCFASSCFLLILYLVSLQVRLSCCFSVWFLS